MYGSQGLYSRLRESTDLRSVGETYEVAKRQVVYGSGVSARSIYLIQSGQVKLISVTASGRECVLAIYSACDFFGELSVAGGCRQETAIAMADSVITEIPTDTFLRLLTVEGLHEDFMRSLINRSAAQQELITNLITIDSEQRLGKTLLDLAGKLGKKDVKNIRIDLRISQEELSMMVGTTRSRISVFLQKFRNLGLISTSADRFLTVDERAMAEYLEGFE
jgi:CRP-like cAMP-binding protein